MTQCAKSCHIADQHPNLSDVGLIHAAAGRRAEAEAEVARIQALGQSGRVVGYDLAVLEAALGRTQEACRSLERAVDDHAMLLGWARLDPRLDPLRGEACFRSVESRIYGTVPTAGR